MIFGNFLKIITSLFEIPKRVQVSFPFNQMCSLHYVFTVFSHFTRIYSFYSVFVAFYLQFVFYSFFTRFLFFFTQFILSFIVPHFPLLSYLEFGQRSHQVLIREVAIVKKVPEKVPDPFLGYHHRATITYLSSFPVFFPLENLTRKKQYTIEKRTGTTKLLKVEVLTFDKLGSKE